MRDFFLHSAQRRSRLILSQIGIHVVIRHKLAGG
jgi:hypothetical protein